MTLVSLADTGWSLCSIAFKDPSIDLPLAFEGWRMELAATRVLANYVSTFSYRPRYGVNRVIDVDDSSVLWIFRFNEDGCLLKR